jgi:hypothetical protein
MKEVCGGDNPMSVVFRKCYSFFSTCLTHEYAALFNTEVHGEMQSIFKFSSRWLSGQIKKSPPNLSEGLNNIGN